MKKPFAIIGFLIFVTFLLSITRTVVLNSMATAGPLLAKVTNDLSHYESDNAILGEQVYAKSSLNNIASRAEKMGFVNQKSGFSLTNAIPIAAVR